MGFALDHIGIAVRSLATAKGIYEKLGLVVSAEEVVEAEAVRVVMVPIGETRLELLEPLSDDSAIAKFIAKRGEGMHHISLRVPDLAAAVAKLKADGVRLVSEEIKIGAGGHRYIFVHPASAGGVLLELVESGRLTAMLILAVDTSGKNGSLALVRFEGATSDTLELVSLDGGMFSAQLVPQISALLKKHGLAKSDIDGFAAAAGPGSFTGLRVGLAAIKALAEILQKPIAAVSLLEVVARAAEQEGKVLAALDAGRGEIYCGEYEISGSRAKLISQQLWSEAEFAAGAAGGIIATPDAKIAEVAREKRLKAILIAPLRADAIARLGFEKIQAGEVVAPEALDATYIRRSDAEFKRVQAP